MSAKTDCQKAEADIEKDQSQCKKDLEQFLSESKTVVSELKQFKFSSAATDLKSMIALVKQLQPDCTQEVQVSRKLSLQDMASCKADLTKALGFVQDIVSQVQSGSPNMQQLEQDVMGVVSEVQAMQTDCASKLQLENVSSCLQDAEDVFAKVQDLVSMAKSGKVNVNEVVQDLEALVADAQKLKTDCTSSKNTLQLENVSSCLQDAEDVFAKVQDLVSMAKSGKVNVNEVVQDLEALVADAQKLKTDCTSSKKSLQLRDMTSCMKDAEDAMTQVQALVAMVQSGKVDVNQVVQDLEAVVADVQKMSTDCASFEKRVLTNDVQQCVQDLEALVSTAEKFETDVKAKKFQNLVSDVETLYKQVMSAKTDCQKAEADIEKDETQCKKDLVQFLTESKTVVSDLKQFKFSSAATDLKSMIALVKQLQPDCTQEIKESRQLSIIIKPWLKDATTCEADFTKALGFVQDIVSQVTSGSPNMQQLEKDVQGVAAEVQAMQTDCASEVQSMTTCLNDAEKIYSAVLDAVNMVKSKKVNFAQLLEDVETIATEIKDASTDCNLSIADQVQFDIKDMNSCITDVEGVAAALVDVVKQVESKSPNFQQLLSDVQTVVSDVTKAGTDCRSMKTDIQYI